MFPSTVERWRSLARTHSAWAAARYGVKLDESDVLALIAHESKSKACPGGGDPTAISHSGCRGLGQFSGKTLKTYNNANPGATLTWADLIDPSEASGQIRAVAWLLAHGRKETSSWAVPDAKASNDLWTDLYYGWGPRNTKNAIAAYRVSHGGASPTFAQLEAATPATFDGDHDGKVDLRPFIHARAVVSAARKDRGEAPAPRPFPDSDAVAGGVCDPVCCAARAAGGKCPHL
jgi:hypothetical protein